MADMSDELQDIKNHPIFAALREQRAPAGEIKIDHKRIIAQLGELNKQPLLTEPVSDEHIIRQLRELKRLSSIDASKYDDPIAAKSAAISLAARLLHNALPKGSFTYEECRTFLEEISLSNLYEPTKRQPQQPKQWDTTVGQELLKLRNAKGMGSEQFRDFLGLPRGRLSVLESGRRPMSPDEFRVVEQKLGAEKTEALKAAVEDANRARTERGV
jgi:hypothetical protein